MFSERDFHFSKYLIIHCKTKDYEKWKSRSENVVFYNQNGVIFHDFHEKSLHFYCKTQRFQNAIFTFHNVELYNGIVGILKSQNRVLKTLCFAIEMKWFLMKIIKNHFISIAKHNVFRTRFSLSIIFSFTMDY